MVRRSLWCRKLQRRCDSKTWFEGNGMSPNKRRAVYGHWCECWDRCGMVVEDAAGLRKKSDYNHINVAKLEASIKGVNLALKWGLKEIEIQTDSVTVRSWIRFMIMNEKRVGTKGAAELSRVVWGFRRKWWMSELKLSMMFISSNRKIRLILWLGWERIGWRWRETLIRCSV